MSQISRSRHVGQIVLLLCLLAGGCDSNSVLDTDAPPQDIPSPPGILEAILEADSTLGPPNYSALLRAVCTTNGGTATISEASLVGPLTNSAGFIMQDTGRGEVGDTLSVVITQPGRALLRCTSSIGEMAFAQLSFNGHEPHINLDPLHATLTRVHNETVIELTDHIQWADSIWVDSVPVDVVVNVERNPISGSIWLRVTPSYERGTYDVSVHASNNFGTNSDQLLLNATYPPGLVLRSVDWTTDELLPSRIAVKDASGRVMATVTVAAGEGFLDFMHLQAPIAFLEAEREGYFTRNMPFTSVHTDRRVDVDIPLLPHAPCMDLFTSESDPLSECLAVTREMLFSTLDPNVSVALEGYRKWPYKPSAGLVFTHHESGARLPSAWAVAVRESANRWRSEGIEVAVASSFTSNVYQLDVERDDAGRWTTSRKAFQVFVPDNSDGAELMVHFREGVDGLHSTVVALPVQEPVDSLFSKLEAIRIRTQLALGTSQVFTSWSVEKQNRFLTNWMLPIRARDWDGYTYRNEDQYGFDAGMLFEDAFPDGSSN